MAAKLMDESCNIEKWFEELWDKSIRLRVKHSAKHKPDIAEAVSLWGRKVDNFMSRLPYHKRLNLCKDVKSNVRALELRTKGNTLLHPKTKRYIEALKYYNESIAHSVAGSEERAIAYANRSMICYELHRYDDCLTNIRLARASNYPERLADKLNKREANARGALLKNANNDTKPYRSGTAREANDSANTLQLSFDAHKNAPQIASCLKLCRNDELGRYVVTTRKVRVGNVVLIEKPYATILYDRQRCVQCAHCRDERLFTLIPCEGCTVAMYCSVDCLSEAYRQYHRYECALIRDLRRIYNRNTAVMAMRTVATAIATSFDNDLEAMKEHLDGLDESTVNPFTMNWNAARPRDVYNTVHVLETNIRRTNKKDLGLQVFIAVLMKRLLIERTELGPICAAKPELAKFLFKLILHHLLLTDQNLGTLNHLVYMVSVKDYVTQSHARTCCSLISMLNHSCDPNVTSITLRDGRCAIVAMKPIAAGAQLCQAYGMFHRLKDRATRQYYLARHFKFRCRCQACLHNFLPVQTVSVEDGYNLVRKRWAAVIDKLNHHEAQSVKNTLITTQTLLDRNEMMYSPVAAGFIQICFVRCLEILYSYTSESADYWQYCNP